MPSRMSKDALEIPISRLNDANVYLVHTRYFNNSFTFLRFLLDNVVVAEVQLVDCCVHWYIVSHFTCRF